MLNYLKEQIKARTAQNIDEPEFDDTDMILECAHLFQELDDLSREGTDVNRERPIGTVVDIPLEDDIDLDAELDTIEFNLRDGRVVDVPMDATVQEGKYISMKTWDDFYQEACTSVSGFMRESQASIDERRKDYANKKYAAYKQYLVQEGMFGFDKRKIDSDEVPSMANVDFGPMYKGSDKSFFTKLKIAFQTDNKHNVTKKQLDSVNYALKNCVCESFNEAILNNIKKNSNVSDNTNVWDIATPNRLLVPMDPTDSYCVVVEYTNELSGKTEYVGWIQPIKDAKDGVIMESVRFESVDTDFDSYENKKSYISNKKEESISVMPNRFGGFYQEAINFGDTDPTTTDDSTNIEVTNNDGENTADGNSDETTITVDDGSGNDAAVIDDATNDVSGDIADKIADDTSADTGIDDTPIEGDGSEPPTDDTTVTPDVDQQLDDLDNAGATDGELGDTGNTDIDKMTMDEILQQATEKLKEMPIEKLKSFLNTPADGDVGELDNGTEGTEELEAEVPTDDGITQEAFVLTSKNVNKEIDVHLRKSLGILNDSEKKVSEIFTEFKKEAKKLNKILSKAGKMDIYTDDEKKDINKLNKCLADLMTAISDNRNKDYDVIVKRLISAFASQSAAVGKIVEDKKGGNNNE